MDNVSSSWKHQRMSPYFLGVRLSLRSLFFSSEISTLGGWSLSHFSILRPLFSTWGYANHTPADYAVPVKHLKDSIACHSKDFLLHPNPGVFIYRTFSSVYVFARVPAPVFHAGRIRWRAERGRAILLAGALLPYPLFFADSFHSPFFDACFYSFLFILCIV